MCAMSLPSSACQFVAATLLLTCAARGGDIANADPVSAPAIETVIRSAFDGRMYAVSFGQDHKSEAGRDVVRFENGKMSTALCIKFGFEPAPYYVRVEASRVYFQSEMVSITQGKNIFSGYVEGDQLIAHSDWAQARWYWTINVGAWFKGSLVGSADDQPVYLK
jgi:hypothetical protein